MDVEKTIEFILNQQAEFAAGMQQLREEFREEEKQRREADSELRDGLTRMVAVVNQLAVAKREFAQYTEQRFQQLAQAQQRTEEKLQGVADDLNALIKVVDDLVRRDGRRRK